MKKLILILAVTLGTCVTIKAQKCKPNASQTDSFTEEKIDYWGYYITSDVRSALMNETLRYGLYILKNSKGEGYELIIGFQSKGIFQDEHADWYKEGTTFALKLENEILTFINKNPTFSITNSGGQSMTQVFLRTIIDKETLGKLASQNIERFRLFPYLDKMEIADQAAVPKYHQKQVRKQFECLVQI